MTAPTARTQRREADDDRRRAFDWIEARGGTATVRELAHGVRLFRGDTARARAALHGLAWAGAGRWVCPKPGRTGGRPTERFTLTTTTAATGATAAPVTQTTTNTAPARPIG